MIICKKAVLSQKYLSPGHIILSISNIGHLSMR